jgi:hypothetical protein
MHYSMKSKKYTSFMLAAICAGALTACGGGGGGTDSPAPTDSATQPPEATTAPATLSMVDAQLLVGRVGSIFGLLGSLSTFSEVAYDRFRAFAPVQETDACELGGTITRLQADADGDWRISKGDSMGTVLSNCTENTDNGAMQTNGRYDIAVLDVSGSGFAYGLGSNWSTRSRQKHAGFTIRGGELSVRYDGEVEVQDTLNMHTYNFFGISQSSMLSSNAIQLVSGQATLEATRVNGFLNGPAKVGFNDVVVKTGLSSGEEVLVTVPASTASSLSFGPDSLVNAGSLVLQLQKARVTVTVLAADQVRIDMDNNSDGTIDATQTHTLSSLVEAATR